MDPASHSATSAPLTTEEREPFVCPMNGVQEAATVTAQTTISDAKVVIVGTIILNILLSFPGATFAGHAVLAANLSAAMEWRWG